MSVGHLFYQITSHTVPIEVVETAAFADKAEVFGVENNIVEYAFVDIGITFVTQSQFADRTARIAEVQVKTVLVTVQCHDGQFVRVLCEADAGNVSIFVQWNLHLTGYFRLDVESVYAYFRVSFACLGIFVGVFTRIFFESTDVRSLSGKEGERVGGYLAFIEADKSQHFAVGTELQCTVEGKLLFINPVGDTVQYFVAFAVLCHLAFAVAEVTFHEEDVVVAHKGYHTSVRREYGYLLRSSVRKTFYNVVDFTVDVAFQTVQIVYGCVRTAIYGSRFCSNEQHTSVWREAVTVECLERTLTCSCCVKQYFYLFAGFKGVFDDLCPISIHLRIVFAITRDGDNAINIFGAILSGHDIF